MKRSLLLIATVVGGLTCWGPARAQLTKCVPVMDDDETEFIKQDNVPPWSGGYCYTFSVMPHHHVDITLTEKVDMGLGISVRDAGTEDYRILFDGVTSFSNFPPVGRVQAYADTSTAIGYKDFRILVGTNKQDPDTSKMFTFHISVKLNK